MTEATLPSAPTSGHAHERSFLEKVMPMSEPICRICADSFLFGLAPAFGRIKTANEPLVIYRFHGENASSGSSFEKKARTGVLDYEQQCAVLERIFLKLGFESDLESRRRNSWWIRVERSINEITSFVSKGQGFIFVDGDAFETDDFLGRRRRVPLLECNGKYWGPPSDDETAIRKLKRFHGLGIIYIIFAWPAFWWLECYSGFRDHIPADHGRVLENDRVVAFDLQLKGRSESKPPLGRIV